MNTSQIHVACMLRANSTSTIYLFYANRMPDDPINELKQLFPDEEYISGFILDNEKYKGLVQRLVNEWNMFDRSLMGIWHDPDFPEIFEELKAYSKFTFPEIKWIVAGLKGDATALIESSDS